MPRATDNSDERLSFATVDVARQARTGFSEVVLGEGKTASEVAGVLGVLRARGQVALATRVDAQKGDEVVALLGGDARYDSRSRTVVLGEPAPGVGLVGVVSAGTSDGAVVAEVEVVARVLGNAVQTFVDVGVAGVHRVLLRLDELRRCNVVVVVAGMDGALPSVVGGLVSIPVIAVPTSVGYGASFGGVAALLAMLNSCAPGVLVVNIDNGFGAAFAASRINRAVALRGARE